MRTVLIIDDEPSLRKIASSALQRLGYRVLTAECGSTAEALLKDDSSVELILIDMSLTGENGEEVLRHLREEHPSLKAILMSGYLPEDSRELFLQKPFNVAALKAVVEKALG